MSNLIILLLCIVVIVIYMLKRNNNFIGFHDVVKTHFSVFKGNRLQILFFYILPLVMAYCITNLGLLNQDIIDNIIIVLGIFISVFFSILGFVIGFPKQIATNCNKEKYLLVHKESFCTTIFEIFICIVTLILAVTYVFFPNHMTSEPGKEIPDFILHLWSFFIYYFLLVCLLNMFIVIKRLKSLYDVQ